MSRSVEQQFQKQIGALCDLMNAVAHTPAPLSDDQRRTQLIRLLQLVLAAENACVVRYRREYALASRLHGEALAQGFLDCARAEEQHVRRVSAQLGLLGRSQDDGSSAPDDDELFEGSSDAQQASHGETLEEMVRADLAVERMLIETFRDLASWAAFHPATAELLSGLADDEEAHLL